LFYIDIYSNQILVIKACEHLQPQYQIFERQKKRCKPQSTYILLQINIIYEENGL